MAKAKSIIFDTLSGKFGSVTSRTRKNKVVTLSANSSPSNPQSPAQTTQRDKYAAAVADWLNLTDEQKAAYGDPSGSLPAYQSYMKTALGPAPLPTGGTITEIGGYRIHTFTENGTFEAFGSMDVEILVIGGGGGGGGAHNAVSSSGGCGGGAGGHCHDSSFPVSAQSYSVTVGTGGRGGYVMQSLNNYGDGISGTDSIFSTITAIGGGFGGDAQTSTGDDGGSGGGGTSPGAGTSEQGYVGGSGAYGTNSGGGAGGGANSAGEDNSGPTGGNGGNGKESNISGTPSNYSEGGGGGGGGGGTGGTGGTEGGAGGNVGQNGFNGTPNKGNGGGGAGNGQCIGGNGGDGIIIISYPL